MMCIPAKCILSGEHTVLTGGQALVVPIKAYSTTLTYVDNASDFDVFFNGVSFFKEIFWLLQRHSLLPLSFSGHIHIESTIPPAMGLGSSASLCVAIASFLAQHNFIPKTRIFDVARLCEDLFHGKSSGADIAGVMAKTPVLFSMNHPIQPIAATWKPFLYLSSSNRASSTKHAIEKVKSLSLSKIDDTMNQATHHIYHALISIDEQIRLRQLSEGIHQAATCFEAWGLISPELRAHQYMLKEAGALATKPTGSGLGGYVLSLWDKEAPFDLIPVIVS